MSLTDLKYAKERIAELEAELHQVKASLIASESLGKLWYKRATKAEKERSNLRKACQDAEGAGNLEGYRDLGQKLAAMERRAEKAEAELAQLKDILTIEREDWKDMNKRWQKAEAELATQTSALEEECYHHERTRTKRNEGLELLRAAIDHNEKVEAERDKLQKDKTCPTCGGQEKIPHWYAMDELGMKPCPDCKGKGGTR